MTTFNDWLNSEVQGQILGILKLYILVLVTLRNIWLEWKLRLKIPPFVIEITEFKNDMTNIFLVSILDSQTTSIMYIFLKLTTEWL